MSSAHDCTSSEVDVCLYAFVRPRGCLGKGVHPAPIVHMLHCFADVPGTFSVLYHALFVPSVSTTRMWKASCMRAISLCPKLIQCSPFPPRRAFSFTCPRAPPSAIRTRKEDELPAPARQTGGGNPQWKIPRPVTRGPVLEGTGGPVLVLPVTKGPVLAPKHASRAWS